LSPLFAFSAQHTPRIERAHRQRHTIVAEALQPAVRAGVEQYQKAFDAQPLPGFLFNIAQCQRNLGDYDAAIFSFKRYLKLDPETEKREQVEELIEELEAKKAEGDTERLGLGKRQRDRDKEEEDNPPREVEGGAPVYKKWWFWTGVAVVGAAGGIGIYYATKSSGGAPGTDLGNIDYPK
jgi:tetratricopeptide (TPR) repeat protein